MMEYMFIFGTAVVFTICGYRMGKNKIRNHVEMTIQSLLDDGYLKAEGTGEEMKILKWREWVDDSSN
jgi:hypothetical protein